MRGFIEKCLVPSSERLSAKELLKDHFLELELSKVPHADPLRIPNVALTFSSTSNYGPDHMDIDHECNHNNGSCASSLVEFQRLYLNNEFKLKGKKNDDNSISFTLRITNGGGKSNSDLVYFSSCFYNVLH